MEELSNYELFIAHWDRILLFAGIGIGGLAVLLIVGHWLVSKIIYNTYKKRYDYLAKNEIKVLNFSFIFIGIAGFAIANGVYTETVQMDYVWFIVRFFIGVAGATLIIYVSHLVFKYSYPSFLDKKLRKLRYKPRISPAGNKMKLLSEDEEDVHLDEGMQAEEEVFSVDYDVWVDDKTNYVKIEKYPGYLSVLDCRNCGFHTLRLVSEELIKAPSDYEEGYIKKYYACTYCTRKEDKLHRVASKTKYKEGYVGDKIPEFALKPGEEAMKKSKIKLVRVTIVSFGNQKDYYEFSNLDAAKKFVNEYNEKL